MIGEILSLEEIEYFKNNKDQITEELLKLLRSKGDLGKKIALQILDTEQDNEKYYLDAFGNRISYNGDRALKKAFTSMALADIHIKEIENCKNNINHFIDNYVQIMTKKGTNFPELREYQKDFIKILDNPENENIISLQGRQSGKSVTVGEYLTYKFNFFKDVTIGICANRASMAREVLDKVRKMFITIPMWMKIGVVTWNKGSLESEKKSRILTDATSGDSFRGFSCNIILIDECAFINSNMFNEFMDSVAPSQSALSFKQMIMISTANGRNHFYDFWKDASEDIKTSKNGFVKFEVNWRDVPRFDAKGNKLEPDEFRNITIKKLGSVYFEQNYGNSFIGSSTTLIPGEILGKYNTKDPEFRYQPGLNVFEEVQPQHKYILGVDPAKDGLDYFAVQVLDITNLNFKQVAAAKLQIDYLSMPEILVEWAQRFNNALLVIENNEGAGQSIADTIFRDYEYENMYFDLKKEKDKDKSRKKYPGFRTTKVTRDLLLQTMKVLAQENKLLVQDKETINELWDFKLINGKYQADDGKHDDTVMALALCLVPFINIKNFEDMKEVIKAIKSKDISEDFDDLIVLGSFDDFIDEETPKNYEYITNSGYY